MRAGLIEAKHASDLGSPALPQLVLAQLIASGELERRTRAAHPRSPQAAAPPAGRPAARAARAPAPGPGAGRRGGPAPAHHVPRAGRDGRPLSGRHHAGRTDPGGRRARAPAVLAPPAARARGTGARLRRAHTGPAAAGRQAHRVCPGVCPVLVSRPGPELLGHLVSRLVPQFRAWGYRLACGWGLLGWWEIPGWSRWCYLTRVGSN